MDSKRVTRKLRAILSADVQGYSRLMGDDEVATFKTITEYREIFSSIVTQYNGRVVDSPGDNILSEFASVVDAVQCAVEIQKVLKAKNEALPENRRMIFRIGVNLGDVIHEDDRIYGDGVNIAARIESLADGGGICISGTAYDQIENKLALGYNFIGDHSVKNIAKPIRVYKVPMAPGDVVKKTKPKLAKNAAIAVAILMILGIAAMAIWNFYFRSSLPSVEPASVEKMAFPLPNKPSIAVLPFDNLGTDVKYKHLGDTITENIITSLSKIPKLFVIARNSTSVYKGKPVKVQQVSEELGARYVLEGSVQTERDNVRVTAQLIDAITGHHIWAERYNRKLKDLFAVMDEITWKIIAGLQVKLTEGEQAHLWGEETGNLEAWDKIMESYGYFLSFSREGNNKAKQLAEEAQVLDPKYKCPYRMLAATEIMDVPLGVSSSPKDSFNRAHEYLKKALALDKSDGHTIGIFSWLFAFMGRNEEAIREGKKAVILAPNDPDVHAWLAISQNVVGNHKEALSLMREAIRLNPMTPNWYFNLLGKAHFGMKQYEEAIAAYKKALQITPNYLEAHQGLAFCYIILGHEDDTRSEISEMLRMNPNYSYTALAPAINRIKDKAVRKRLVEGLRKAGLPKMPSLPVPDKPSIAVLPFKNISGDPKENYLSDGITEQIITALSKTPRLFVIARNSVFTYKGKPVKVQQVSKELGVRYVLEGSVQKSGDRVRITAQLIDARTGNHIWAEKYDKQMKDIFALEDEITMKVLQALQVKLTEGEQTRIYGRRTDNLEAYLKLQKGREHLHLHDQKDHQIAKQMFEEAVSLDPNYPTPYEFLAVAHLMDVIGGYTNSPGESIKTAYELSQKLLTLDNSNAGAHRVLSFLHSVRRENEKAVIEAKMAIELDPNDADGYAFWGLALGWGGKHKQAIPILEKAILLNPIPPSWYLRELGWDYYWTGQNQKVTEVFKRLINRDPKYSHAYAGLGVCLIQAGKPREAVLEFDKALSLNPDLQSWVTGCRILALAYTGSPEKAFTKMQDLVNRKPKDADFYRLFSYLLRNKGKYEEGLQMAKEAAELVRSANNVWAQGTLHLVLEQYNEAIVAFESSISLWPDYMDPRVWLAATYSLLGRTAEAKNQVAKVHQLNENYSIEDFAKDGFYGCKKEDKERLLTALGKTGLK